MVVFIFSSFQSQLLTCLPPTVRSNHFSGQEGLPYIRTFTEDADNVSQHIMRNFYAGLAAHLTRFAATQYTAIEWNNLSSIFLSSFLAARNVQIWT